MQVPVNPKTVSGFLKLILVYQLATSCWALLDLDSFMAVTGYKTDQWLVKTVALLLLCLNAPVFYCLLKNNLPRILEGQQISMSTALIAVDVYYSLTGVISKIYLLDAHVQFVAILLWLIFMQQKKQ